MNNAAALLEDNRYKSAAAMDHAIKLRRGVAWRHVSAPKDRIESYEMKFRARTSNDNLLLIYGVINQIEKNSIGDKLAVYLTEDCIRLSVINNDIDNTRCYSELAVPAIFSEYIIESKADNAILFEIGLNNLFKALQSGILSY